MNSTAMSITESSARTGRCAKQGNSPKILMDYCDVYLGPNGSILLALADGMGGYGGGEVASETAVKTAIEVFSSDGFANPRRSMDRAFQLANERIVNMQRNDPRLAQMGTTMVLATIVGNKVLVGHVGDSRACLFRDKYLMRLTTDHLVVVERENALDNGVKSNPQFRGKANVLSRYIGGPPPRPDYMEIDGEPGDIVLLASDGITEYVLENRLSKIVRSSPPESAAVQIVDEAIRNHSHDHCSIAIGRV